MLFLTLVLACGSVSAVPKLRNVMRYHPEKAESYFEEFIETHDKNYMDEYEKQRRFKIFKENLDLINDKNADEDEHATFGVTYFSDMTLDEFRSMGGLAHEDKGTMENKCSLITKIEQNKVPEAFSWADTAVTAIKNQGHHNTCWTFSSTGVIEGQYAIKHKKLVEFSEQQLVDCAYSVENGGGVVVLALSELVEQGGSSTESEYRYNGYKGECKFNKTKITAKIISCNYYNLTDEEQLKQLLVQYGPVSISIDAKSIKQYQTGILKNCEFESLDHAVLLIGYGHEDGLDYWLIKNSWGGDSFLKVLRGVNACGLLNDSMSTAEVE